MNLRQAQDAAVSAAISAGRLIRKNLHSVKKVNSETSHDIKLELDVRCQELIEKRLHRAFPAIAFLGEEGSSGAADSEMRWVVDPIDGTVNFARGIPHASVSIALQVRGSDQVWDAKPAGASSNRRKLHTPAQRASHLSPLTSTVVGVVYDPFTDELWTAMRGQPARLNGRVIHVSRIRTLAECIASIGFAKNRSNLHRALPYFLWLSRRVRKIRMMGSAALALTYVASGRYDAYVERGISLWDIAAGGLILECAGGRFWFEPTPGKHKYRMIASNGLVHGKLPLPK